MSADTAKPVASSGGVERCRGPDCDKPVKHGSVYCTEACIHAHAQESLQLLRQERSKNSSARVSDDCVLRYLSPNFYQFYNLSVSCSWTSC